MDLKSYFEQHTGTGVLATADDQGNVDGAVYARPYVLEEDRVAFVMADRLTHANLQTNGKAAYVFHADGKGYEGLRLYLTKLSETDDEAALAALPQRCHVRRTAKYEGKRYRVEFRVDKVRVLVGSDEP